MEGAGPLGFVRLVALVCNDLGNDLLHLGRENPEAPAGFGEFFTSPDTAGRQVEESAAKALDNRRGSAIEHQRIEYRPIEDGHLGRREVRQNDG